jgi:sugar lactone lactonase YvrE
VVADGIWFANGVALSRDESFIVVAETFGCRLLRHWLKGEKAGSTEVGFVIACRAASVVSGPLLNCQLGDAP